MVIITERNSRHVKIINTPAMITAPLKRDNMVTISAKIPSTSTLSCVKKENTPTTGL